MSPDEAGGTERLREAAARLEEIATLLDDPETGDAKAVELAQEAAEIAARAGSVAAEAAREAAEHGSENG